MPSTFRRSLSSLALTAALVLPSLGAACGGAAQPNGPDAAPRAVDGPADTTIPTEPPHIRGTITQVQPGADTPSAPVGGSPNAPVSCPPSCGGGTPLRGVLIEQVPGQQSGDKSRVTVLKEARLLRRTATGVVPMQFAELRVGQRAEAWFSGPVAESYPTQARARVIVVDDR